MTKYALVTILVPLPDDEDRSPSWWFEDVPEPAVFVEETVSGGNGKSLNKGLVLTRLAMDRYAESQGWSS